MTKRVELVRASSDEYSEVGPIGNWNLDNSYKETPLDWSSPQPFPEQLTPSLTTHPTTLHHAKGSL